MRQWTGLVLLLFLNGLAYANYGRVYCNEPDYTCIKVKKGQSWTSLWPDPYQRDIVKRVNRLNIPLTTGMTLAVPKNLPQITVLTVAPFESKIAPQPNKTILVAPALLAWAAYDTDGTLVKWGPMSGGKDYCEDVDSGCRSKTGSYTIYEKRGPECISTKFPIDEGGGAPMPYCMFYSGGFALHGSPQVPGYHASHGCIRLFNEDARWLNYEFAKDERVKVIVLPYDMI